MKYQSDDRQRLQNVEIVQCFVSRPKNGSAPPKNENMLHHFVEQVNMNHIHNPFYVGNVTYFRMKHNN